MWFIEPTSRNDDDVPIDMDLLNGNTILKLMTFSGNVDGFTPLVYIVLQALVTMSGEMTCLSIHKH